MWQPTGSGSARSVRQSTGSVYVSCVFNMYYGTAMVTFMRHFAYRSIWQALLHTCRQLGPSNKQQHTTGVPKRLLCWWGTNVPAVLGHWPCGDTAR